MGTVPISCPSRAHFGSRDFIRSFENDLRIHRNFVPIHHPGRALIVHLSPA